MSKATIVVTTRNRSAVLKRTLDSILFQNTGVPVVVVDDDSSDDTEQVCQSYTLRYIKSRRPSRFGKTWEGVRNPGHVMNIGIRAVDTPIIILQSDDVIHQKGAINALCQLAPRTANIATVLGCDNELRPSREITGPNAKSLRFCLGAIHVKHFYAVGGCDEEFIYYGHEDAWMAACLQYGQKIQPVFREDAIGYHIDHPISWNEAEASITRLQYDIRNAQATAGLIPWCSSGGPWEQKDD